MKIFHNLCLILIFTVTIGIFSPAISARADESTNKNNTISISQLEASIKRVNTTDVITPNVVTDQPFWLMALTVAFYLVTISTSLVSTYIQVVNFMDAHKSNLVEYSLYYDPSANLISIKWDGRTTSLQFSPSDSAMVVGFNRPNNWYRVCDVQACLNKRENAGLSVDGSFGNKTYNAILTWQRNHGLSDDGVCGHDTWTSLAK